MKQIDDTSTMDMLESVKRQRGRPAKPDALSGAERARLFRERQRAAGVRIARVPQSTLDEAAKQVRKAEEVEQHRAMSLGSAHSEIRRLLEKIEEQDAEIKALKRALQSRKK